MGYSVEPKCVSLRARTCDAPVTWEWPEVWVWAMESLDEDIDRVVKKTSSVSSLLPLTILGDGSYSRTNNSATNLGGNSPQRRRCGSRLAKVRRRRRFLQHSSKIGRVITSGGDYPSNRLHQCGLVHV